MSFSGPSVEPSQKGGLYVIWLSDAHYYGGRAKNFKTRWKSHLRALRAGTHENARMQAVYNLHGRFEPTVFLALPDDAQQDEEQKWIDENFRKPGCVNVSPFALGGCGGHTPETRRKMSVSHSRPDLVEAARKSLETVRSNMDPEKQKAHLLSIAGNMKGRKQAPETVAKRAASNTGRKNTSETIAQMSESAKLRSIVHPTSHGSETRALISSQQKGRVWANDGTRNIRVFPHEVPSGWSAGRF